MIFGLLALCVCVYIYIYKTFNKPFVIIILNCYLDKNELIFKEK